jgi:hypothetical protein
MFAQKYSRYGGTEKLKLKKNPPACSTLCERADTQNVKPGTHQFAARSRLPYQNNDVNSDNDDDNNEGGR